MSELLIRPNGKQGEVQALDPADATGRIGCENWAYVGFSVHRLSKGDVAEGLRASEESILVFVEGRGQVSIGGKDFGVQGGRMSVFKGTPPTALYVPPGQAWGVTAMTDGCELAVCRAPAETSRYPAQVLTDIRSETRGSGSNRRQINAIAMEDQQVAESLLVTEVFTPAGNWSSYPPHRHDVDDFPNITYLEETYYHRVKPGPNGEASGYGHQRVFTEDGSLDESMAITDRDLVLVPKGHHPVGAAHGYDLYYLNVMAGPLRHWRFQNHPDHEWIVNS